MIYENPTHGYQLMEEMETRGFVLPARLESGAVYTILRRMETHGLLVSRWEKVASGPDRRIYTITDEGAQALKTGLETIVRRQSLMENLVAFYNDQFKSDENEKNEGEN
jgi:DNA-binding PadR family transcriptional regulator